MSEGGRSPAHRSVGNGEVPILGVPVQALTAGELNAWIGGRIENGERALVLNVNAHAFNLAHRDVRLRRLLITRADLVFADGAGVVLAARMIGMRIPGRITYADWIWSLAAVAEDRGYSMFFLGARPGIADRAADRLRDRHPSLRIVGVQNGYFNRSRRSAENEDVVARINATNPDILIVGFGMPHQEFWLEDNWDLLNARIGLTGGAVFDYASGELRRGPAILVDNGLESVARLLVEPRRLFRRYVVGNPAFLSRVAVQRGRQGVIRTGERIQRTVSVLSRIRSRL
jgi:N-acetylglucosaminyldiphosphoundecaprenol N-acetyl-beta-D-mannosaminyltransferase